MATIVKLIPGDKGRPITDLVSDLDYPALADDVRTVLRKLVSIEKPVAARDGRWFTVRIMPYRTMDDAVDGVVITFANITAAKTLEAKLLARQANLEERLGQLPPGSAVRARRETADRDPHRFRHAQATRPRSRTRKDAAGPKPG